MRGTAAAAALEREGILDLHTNPSLEPLLRGDPIDAMEAAKHIIGRKIAVEPGTLEAILSDRKYRKWSRIAAIYSVGFIGERSAVPALRQILSNREEPTAVRAHAAEALGNIGDAGAVPIFAELLKSEPSPALRKSCVYALGEIDTPEARAAIQCSSPPRRPRRSDRQPP